MKTRNIAKFFQNKKRSKHSNAAASKTGDDATDATSSSLTAAQHSVCFVDNADEPETMTIIPHAQEDYILEEEDIRQLWYTAEECKQMKVDLSVSARSITAKCIARKALCAHDTDSYLATLARVYQACSTGKIASKQDEDALTARIRETMESCCCIGMEHKLLSATADKQDRRERLIELCMPSSLEAGEEEWAALLRKKCAQVSRPARVFAVQLARANAAAGV